MGRGVVKYLIIAGKVSDFIDILRIKHGKDGDVTESENIPDILSHPDS